MAKDSTYTCIEVRTHKKNGYVQDLKGTLLKIPKEWSLLPPGDAALSRRIKKAHDCWVIKEPKGRKLFSKGILSDTATIEKLKAELVIERENPNYEKKLEAGRKRRAKQEVAYRDEFMNAISQFLSFLPAHKEQEQKMALLITEHAIPVGSNTVARTKTIPIEKRAEAATIAWMRHQTTAYDSMNIARVKGARREVRRELASISRDLLNRYRRELSPENIHLCPLYKALHS